MTRSQGPTGRDSRRPGVTARWALCCAASAFVPGRWPGLSSSAPSGQDSSSSVDAILSETASTDPALGAGACNSFTVSPLRAIETFSARNNSGRSTGRRTAKFLAGQAGPTARCRGGGGGRWGSSRAIPRPPAPAGDAGANRSAGWRAPARRCWERAFEPAQRPGTAGGATRLTGPAGRRSRSSPARRPHLCRAAAARPNRAWRRQPVVGRRFGRTRGGGSVRFSESPARQAGPTGQARPTGIGSAPGARPRQSMAATSSGRSIRPGPATSVALSSSRRPWRKWADWTVAWPAPLRRCGK